MATHTAVAFELSKSTRELFALMNLSADIPAEARYLAFLDDGNACFLTEINFEGEGFVPRFPRMKMLSYYDEVTVEV